MKGLKKIRVAIVTGGASGIGFAIANKFVKNNIKVILIGRDRSKLKLACETLGVLSDFEGCDLSDLHKLPSVVKKIWDKNGQIDILVNNAGMHLKKPMDEVTDDDFQSDKRGSQNDATATFRGCTEHQFNGISVWSARCNCIYGFKICS